MPRFNLRRRALAWIAGLGASPLVGAGERHAREPAGTVDYAPVVPGHTLRFPHDHGSHPLFRIEWWYVTGWLEGKAREPCGFQVTFFRTRTQADPRNPSAFTPQQIMIAHAALSVESRGRLTHDQKVARAAHGLAGAAEGTTRVWIDQWSLARSGTSYGVRLPAREFALELELVPTQPPLLQGDAGYSRKGPLPESASYYYSLPHLAARGTLADSDGRSAVTGSAWLDHEWSSSLMDERASGWDWVGINLDDGSALMAFRMRSREGGALWAAGAYRSANGATRAYAPHEVRFTETRSWRSPRTGATYPVAFRVRAGDLEVTLTPLMDDQEHDTRASVGAVYWEGAVTATIDGRPAGRGYLELTGYVRPLTL